MLERLIAFICEELGCDESQINGETVLNELVSDDIEIQELASELENEFGIEFSEEIGNDITVSELAERVERDS